MRILQIPVLQDNYTYLVICEKTGLACVVDSPDAPAVRNAAKKAGVDLVAILNTHHHWDHVGANEDLLSKKKLDVYGSHYDRDRIPGLTHPLKEGDAVELGSLRFRVLEAPGHTLGHILYEGDGVLFCGDTVFVAGCGRLFEGSPAQMYHSLQKIKSLPSQTRLYCAHEYSQKNLEFTLTVDAGNTALQAKYRDVLDMRARNEPTVPTTLQEELAYNPFLRAQNQEEFTRLRQLKDHY